MPRAGPAAAIAAPPRTTNGIVTDAGHEDEPPPWPGVAGLTQRHLDLYRALLDCADSDTMVAHVKHATIAERIGLKGEPRPGKQAQGSRQVRRLMAELIRRGWVIEANWRERLVPGRDGGSRRGASYYHLQVKLLELPPPCPSGPTRANGVSATRAARTGDKVDSSQLAPLGHAPPCPSKNVLPETLLDEGKLVGVPIVEPRERQPVSKNEPAATYRLARGRVVDLERASLADFHRAVDQLDRDTCTDGSPCQPGRSCRRHTWRKRPAS